MQRLLPRDRLNGGRDAAIQRRKALAQIDGDDHRLGARRGQVFREDGLVDGERRSGILSVIGGVDRADRVTVRVGRPRAAALLAFLPRMVR